MSSPPSTSALLTFSVVSTDHRGRPTERVCRLPGLLWPGLAVFDFCGGPGSSRGRYVLMQRVGPRSRTDETYTATGLAFATQRALREYLASTLQ